MYRNVVGIELTLILLVAPAVTAGAVCLDKARGTLDHMLATDLSNAEIVLGKLGVRLIPVLGLIACMVPVLALAGLLGGIDPLALVGSFLVAIGCAFVGCSLAMTLSVYGRKTHEVLIMTYLIVILWVMAPVLVMVIVRTGADGRAASPGAGDEPRGMTLYEWVEMVESLLPGHARPTRSPGKVGVETYLGFLAGCLADLGRAGGPGDGADPRRGVEAGGSAGGPARLAAAARLAGAAAAARPVAGFQPGGLAGVAPRAAVADDAGRLGPVRGPGAARGSGWRAGPERGPVGRRCDRHDEHVPGHGRPPAPERDAPRPAWRRSGRAAASTSCSRPRCRRDRSWPASGGAPSAGCCGS